MASAERAGAALVLPVGGVLLVGGRRKSGLMLSHVDVNRGPPQKGGMYNGAAGNQALPQVLLATEYSGRRGGIIN